MGTCAPSMWRRIRCMIGDGLEGEADEVFSSYSFPIFPTLPLLAAGSDAVLFLLLFLAVVVHLQQF